jgi:hypothetical protein
VATHLFHMHHIHLSSWQLQFLSWQLFSIFSGPKLLVLFWVPKQRFLGPPQSLYFFVYIFME